MALVMYDLDGTLVDTANEITKAVNLTLEDFSCRYVDEADVRRWIGHGTGWLMEQAWAANAAGKMVPWNQVMERFVIHYGNTAGTSSELFPKVLDTLEKVRSIGVKQAIITNKETVFTDRVLASYDLRKYFDMVICGDTLPFKKPHPGVIEHCIHSMESSPGHSLFVGDSEIDVATAKGAGVVCWAVPYGYNHGRPIALADPDRVVPDISDVPNYFRGIQ
jgi:phosphoglycolate phosphatase